jgi:hypothetical protein
MLELPPNQVVLVQMHERLNLPNDLVGHLSLKVDVLLEGVIMSSQSQIDAGYKGPIYALLYNLNDRSVWLPWKRPILRLEFARLDRPTSPYRGDFKPDSTLTSVLQVHGPVNASLFAVAAEFRQARSDLNGQVTGIRRVTVSSAVAVLVAVVGTLLTIYLAVLAPFVHDTDTNKIRLVEQGRILTQQQNEIARLQSRLIDVENRLQSNGSGPS